MESVISPSRLVPRFATARLLEAIEDSPAVLIGGPRQCGKTTLALSLCEQRYLAGADRLPGLPPNGLGYAYITFDDPAAQAAAKADPAGFVADLPDRTVLDEVQTVPGIFSALKVTIDRERVPGRFVLTGSANVLRVPMVADSLAGRMETVRLYPLAQAELATATTTGLSLGAGSDPPMANPASGFLNTLFYGGFKTSTHRRMGTELAKRIAGGGYPAALARPPGARRTRWYRDYIDALIQRDVTDLARISNLGTLPRLLEVAAAQSANLFNVSRIAAPFQLSVPTVRTYLTLFERLFLVDLLPPWHNNRLKRLVKTPKLHLGDTGLACALLGADTGSLVADRQMLGRLLETFVYGELRRQAIWLDDAMRFYHFRDRDAYEVDIVIERSSAQVAGIEVKAAATVTESDFRGLRKLQAAAGSRFAGGILLYDGELGVTFGNGLRAVPISRLWTPSPS